MRATLAAAIFFNGVCIVCAQGGYTPKTGSAERTAIMDVLRPACERDVGQKVIFRVEHLRLVGEWALARVAPRRPDGSEIDFSKTKYREANAEAPVRPLPAFQHDQPERSAPDPSDVDELSRNEI